MQALYGVLCILGTVLRFAQLVPWLATAGLDFPALIPLIVAQPISAFA